jgi:tRNA modification GTPase
MSGIDDAHAPPIAAIATAPGRGGIGIVRVSGAEVTQLIVGIAGRVLPPRQATRVTFRDARGAAIDEGLALYFLAPHSYTGQHVVEWHGHGGPAVMRLLLARCVELGARLAEPGEFTKRAFLNGKLDLAQAESVADIIEASTATAVRAAARSLSGEFSSEVHALRDALIRLRAYTEATLDFPDEDIDLLQEGDVREQLHSIRARLDRVRARARGGVALREGLAVVLVGAPNVGKSSLLNRLVGAEAAIVAALPGTTRDTIERRVENGGIPVTVIDTAGLRHTLDSIERLGIARTRGAIAHADIALLLVDARDVAVSVAQQALEAELPPALPRIVVHNKCDLAGVAPHIDGVTDAAVGAKPSAARTAPAHVWLSALTGAGVDVLQSAVHRVAGVADVGEDAIFARTRHVAALDVAAQHLEHASAHLAAAPAVELFAEELRAAQQSFASITGEFTSDDLLGEIFSRFCIGK